MPLAWAFAWCMLGGRSLGREVLVKAAAVSAKVVPL